MFNISCVIFAGGKSSRMGEDKALLPFSNFKTLTEFQYERLKKIFQNVYISCKDKNKFDFDADFIEDNKTNLTSAPTSGFCAVFDKLKCNSFFAISVDSPFINIDIIDKIIKADKGSCDATIAKTNMGAQPLCGIYHSSLKNKFKDMLKLQEHKLGLLLKNSKTVYVYFDDEKPFLNLNYPHEYKKALTLLEHY